MKTTGAGALIANVVGVIFMAVTAVLPSTGQTPATLLTTVSVGSSPVAVAANSATNKIYAVNQNSNNMAVIDGVTYSSTTVPTGLYPDAVAVNPATNMIYVANYDSHSVTVVNGATNRVSATVQAGFGPKAVAVNTVTNKIYVADYCATAYCTVTGNQCRATIIDGATNLPTNVTVSTQQGCHPNAVAVNTVTNKIYVTDWGSNDVAIIDGATNSLITTVPLASYGAYPQALAIDQNTKQIFVALYGANSTCNPSLGSSYVVDIDGTTNSVNASVPVGICPTAIAVNPASGQVYVANYGDGTGDGTSTVTIISEGTLSPTTVVAGYSPIAVDVDPVTNKAYVANFKPDPNLRNTVTVIDGYTASALAPVLLDGNNAMYPKAIVVNPVSNSAYVADSGYNSVSVIGGASADPLQFVPVTPCRVIDTRQQPNGYLPGGMARSFAVPQSNCNIPATAIAYSLNVTAVPLHGRLLGYLTVWPTGEPQPNISTLNSYDGRVKANAAILPAGGAGAVSIYATNSTDVILDINGYFQWPDPNIPTLQFYPLTPCRVVDTRPGGPNYAGLGPPSLSAQAARELPILNASPCFQQLPPGVIPAAYSFNVTVAPNPPGQILGYVTLWPSDQHQPNVSTLNNPTATVVANAAIVPAAPNGDVDVYAYNSTDLVIDLNGYFAPPGLGGGLSLYPSAPCRVFDSRLNGGAFNGQRYPPINVAASACGIPSTAQGYVFNATVVPSGLLGYLTLWADPTSQPYVSALNALDGAVTSNMAIVSNQDGSIDTYAYGLTDLILDISSYLAP